MPWFISAPPPSSAHVPRQRAGRSSPVAEPFHARRDQQRSPEAPVAPPRAPHEIGLHAVLEEHAEDDAGAIGAATARRRAGRDVDGLFASTCNPRRRRGCPARHAVPTGCRWPRGPSAGAREKRRGPHRAGRMWPPDDRPARFPPWTATMDVSQSRGRPRVRLADVARPKDADFHEAILPNPHVLPAVARFSTCSAGLQSCHTGEPKGLRYTPVKTALGCR